MLGFITAQSLLIFALTLLLIWFINTLIDRRRLPPGPFPIPVFGNFLQGYFGHKNFDAFRASMLKNYGKVFFWKLGRLNVLNIADQKILNEAFVKKSAFFSNRPNHLLPNRRIQTETNNIGVVSAEGALWKDLRRLSLTAMRDLGVGKKTLEDKISSEISVILEYIEKHEGQPHCYKSLMTKATSNIICSIVFGDRFQYDDPKFVHLLGRVEALFSGTGRSPAFFNIVNVLPAIYRALLFLFSGSIPGMVLRKEIGLHIKELTEEHVKTFEPGNIRDFIDLAIDYKHKESDKAFTEQHIRNAIADFFLAGSDTTANSLYWGLLYMAAFPHVQKRCQEEIDQVVGRARAVSLADKAKLKYVEATILETLRMGIVAPNSVPHCTSADVELAGYIVPKDTIVFASISEMCRDPDVWNEPEKFDPGRFLDADNNLINKELLVNFSVGPRSCIGEILSKMEMSMMFPSILQHYRISPGTEGGSVDLKAFRGLTVQGKKQDLILTKR